MYPHTANLYIHTHAIHLPTLNSCIHTSNIPLCILNPCSHNNPNLSFHAHAIHSHIYILNQSIHPSRQTNTTQDTPHPSIIHTGSITSIHTDTHIIHLPSHSIHTSNECIYSHAQSTHLSTHTINISIHTQHKQSMLACS